MAAYRLTVDAQGVTHLEALDLADRPFENGPGAFKGVGGTVLGDASRLMLMRFESGSHPEFHRAIPAFAILLSGEMLVSAADGAEARLAPGDAVRVETHGRGQWRLGNPGVGDALLALVAMPPPPSSEDD